MSMLVWVVSGTREGVLGVWDALDRECRREGVPHLVIVGDNPEPGVDALALQWTQHRRVPVIVACAQPHTFYQLRANARAGLTVVLASDWGVDGLSAGPKRNNVMLTLASPAARRKVIAFPGPKSRGTYQCADEGARRGFEVRYPYGDLRGR